MSTILSPDVKTRVPEPQETNRCFDCGADLGGPIVWYKRCPGCDQPVQAVLRVSVLTANQALAAFYRAEDRYNTLIDGRIA